MLGSSWLLHTIKQARASLILARYKFRLPRRALPPLQIRPLEPRDVDTCREIYQLNAPGRFPPNYFEIFQEALTGRDDLFLVAEYNHRVVALSGVRITPYDHRKCAALSYGIIHPDAQNKGIGTALFLARLAILPDQPESYFVTISPVPKSRSFYTQFGFRFLNHFVHKKDAVKFELLGVILTGLDRSACRRLLENASINLEISAEIPVLSMDVANADYIVS